MTRKIFRFKYEPCSGMCYAWCGAMIHCLRNDPDSKQLVAKMVEAHAHLCDNPDYSFGVDHEGVGTNVYIAHFRTPDRTEIFASYSFRKVVEAVCDVVMATEVPKVDGQCVYGDNGAEDLGQEILHFCSDLGFKELDERHCECKVHA